MRTNTPPARSRLGAGARTFARVLLAFGLPVLLAAGVGGCQLLAWFVAAFAPPRKVQAIYKIPPNKRILIFVDDFRRPVNYEPIKHKLSEAIAKELVENKVTTQIVPYEKLENLFHTERDFNRMPIPNIGQKVGADIIVYAEIRKFSLKENDASPLWQGQMEVNVKVVDSRTGVLWPQGRPDGTPVTYAQSKPSENLSESYGITVANNLAAELGRKVARQFYDYTEPTDFFEEEQK